MPVYEYQCERCGHVFEHYQSMTEAPLKKCPKCGGPVARLISGGIVVTDKKRGRACSGPT